MYKFVRIFTVVSLHNHLKTLVFCQILIFMQILQQNKQKNNVKNIIKFLNIHTYITNIPYYSLTEGFFFAFENANLK